MSHDSRLVIRLDIHEELAIRRFASRAKLPPSTIARALLLNAAERLDGDQAGLTGGSHPCLEEVAQPHALVNAAAFGEEDSAMEDKRTPGQCWRTDPAQDDPSQGLNQPENTTQTTRCQACIWRSYCGIVEQTILRELHHRMMALRCPDQAQFHRTQVRKARAIRRELVESIQGVFHD